MRVVLLILLVIPASVSFFGLGVYVGYTHAGPDGATAVLLVAGQSNAANSQGQRYQSPDDRVVNFSEGHCYRAASPLLGADDQRGESWTLLGTKLVRAG